MGVYAGDTVPYLTETFNVAPDVQRYIGNALVRDNDDVKPTLDLDFANNKSLTDDVSGDNLITFTRTTAGTYVDSEGIIRTSGGNLIRNSEEVVNGIWSLFEVDVTPNATIAPDNTNTADFVFENTNATQHRFDTPVFTSTAGTVYTYSIFLKANGRDTVTLQLKQIGEALGVYELTGDGTAHSFGNGGSGTIIKYPNGWYRCILTTTATASVTAYGRVFLQTNATEGGLGVYVWCAHKEKGTTASQYLKTTTATNYFTRYDHDPETLERIE